MLVDPLEKFGTHEKNYTVKEKEEVYINDESKDSIILEV